MVRLPSVSPYYRQFIPSSRGKHTYVLSLLLVLQGALSHYTTTVHECGSSHGFFAHACETLFVPLCFAFVPDGSFLHYSWNHRKQYYMLVKKKGTIYFVSRRQGQHVNYNAARPFQRVRRLGVARRVGHAYGNKAIP